MSTETPAQKPRQKQTGFISAFIWLILKMLVTSLLSWLFLLIWFVRLSFTNDQIFSIHKAQSIVTNNLRFLTDHSSFLTKALLSNFHVMKLLLANAVLIINSIDNDALHTTFNLLIAVTEIQLIRLTIFIVALPLFVILLSVFITDGLVKRDIRKFQAARESTFIFHRLKQFADFSFLATFFVYLSLPTAINPMVILIPHMLIVSISTSLMITYFKKYV